MNPVLDLELFYRHHLVIFLDFQSERDRKAFINQLW